MDPRRALCLMLGAWLMGGFLLAFIASENLRSPDRIMRDPHPVVSIIEKQVGKGDMRALFRHQASQMNRNYFEMWEVVQLMLGATILVFYLLSGHVEWKRIALVVFMLAIASGQRFYLTPKISELGRNIDFAAQLADKGVRTQFDKLHATYMGMEMGKWLAGLTAGALFTFSRGSRVRVGRSRRSSEVDDSAE